MNLTIYIYIYFFNVFGAFCSALNGFVAVHFQYSVRLFTTLVVC